MAGDIQAPRLEPDDFGVRDEGLGALPWRTIDLRVLAGLSMGAGRVIG